MSHHFRCPHCNGGIEVLKKDMNCLIFRHGILRDTGKPMNAHEKKTVCIKLFLEGKIHGCGKPFKLCRINEGIVVITMCDYI